MEVRWTEEEDNRLVELSKEGTTLSKISHLMGRSSTSLKNRILTLGIKRRNPRLSIEYTKEEVLQAIRDNPTLKARDFVYKDGLPPINKIIDMFGSFAKAIEAAGVQKVEKITKVKSTKLATVYLISFDKFYKVGITTLKLKTRLSKIPVPCETILYLDLPLDEARELEKYWLKSIRPYCIPEVLEELKYFGGKTECFIY